MKYVLEADPEVATYAFFEPTAVATDFELANRNNSHDETLQNLQREGKVIVLHTDGNTGETLHVYVDKPAPQSLANFVSRSHTIESFRIRGNELHFSGIAGYIHPDEFHLPATGAAFPIVPGVYRVGVNEMDVDNRFRMQILAQHASPTEYFLIRWFDTLMIAVAIILLCCLVSVFFLSWLAWLVVMVFIAVPAFLLPQFWARSKAYQRGMRIWAKFHKQQVPDLIATFDRISG